MNKDKRKGLYEGMYILSATLSDESRKKAFDKITDGITEKGGEIHKIHEQGRKKLAYTIDGKREGYYYVVYFTTLTQSIAELWKEYHLHEDLIRFMTMRAEKVLETLEFQPLKSVG
ncbi:MAG: 30S ribosomal protein S6 [Chlamydiae bacterium CG10_big_fil_rev_8_21_14_0_10_42_34]|nr:MAG: 30S ribosomal protein S6 [Chlamydiae bacterium CG10_big_fil_rev_8_21_14_0_10_42_34]